MIGSGLKLVLKPTLLLIGLSGAALSLRLLPFAAVLKHHAGMGPVDAAWFVALGALACAVGVPRQIVAFAGGYVWGLWAGIALAMLAQAAGCAADLFWARLIARDWVQARLRGRMRRLDMMLTARPFSATLALRLMPVGNNLLLNLLAGVSAVPAAGFLAGSIVGFLPQTAIFALIGSGGRIAESTRIGAGIALFAVSVALGLFMLRRKEARQTA
ncbi:MAG: TVP38/TMEM64 family protein [Acidiphilium sp.]